MNTTIKIDDMDCKESKGYEGSGAAYICKPLPNNPKHTHNENIITIINGILLLAVLLALIIGTCDD